MKLESTGNRLITLTGFNNTGQIKLKARRAKQTRSGRKPGEPTIRQVLPNDGLGIGASIIAKGNGHHIRATLGEKVGVGRVRINQEGDGYRITRTR